MRYLFLLLLLISTLVCSSQNSVLITVSPQNTIIEIDGEKVKNNTRVDLNLGAHIFKAWSPNFGEFSDSITISKNTKIIRKVLIFEKSYKQYLVEKRLYRISKNFQIVGGSLLSLASLSLLTYKYPLYSDAKWEYNRKYEDSKNAYNKYLESGTPNEARDNYKKFNEYYKSYESSIPEYIKQRREFYLLTTTSIVSSVGMYFIINKWRKMKKPIKPLINKPLWVVN